LKNLTSQRGAAIIVALFVVALVAAIAAIMIERLRTDVRRTELILNANTAQLDAQGSLFWAVAQLDDNWVKQVQNKVIDTTPIISPKDTVNGALVSGIIYDAQGYFNINNLTDQQYQNIFVRLIRLVAPEINPADAQKILLATLDWISAGTNNQELNDYYLKLPQPYKAPHKLMFNISELRLVKGITPALFAKLSPYIIALPRATPININNAEVPVLMSLSPSLTRDSANAIRNAAKRNPFPTTEAFQNFDVVKNNPFDNAKITVQSSYFLVKTDVTLGQQTLTLYTLLERTTQERKTKISVLWQSKGTL
jgi:general secretion pathway protein K